MFNLLSFAKNSLSHFISQKGERANKVGISRCNAPLSRCTWLINCLPTELTQVVYTRILLKHSGKVIVIAVSL